jgi:hypothetical protein
MVNPFGRKCVLGPDQPVEHQIAHDLFDEIGDRPFPEDDDAEPLSLAEETLDVLGTAELGNPTAMAVVKLARVEGFLQVLSEKVPNLNIPRVRAFLLGEEGLGQ